MGLCSGDLHAQASQDPVAASGVRWVDGGGCLYDQCFDYDHCNGNKESRKKDGVARQQREGDSCARASQGQCSDDLCAQISQRLAATKVVRWIGRGELLQVPWDPPTMGPVLLIDLWSGISGASVALLSLGVRFYGLAAEHDPVFRAVAQENLSQLVHLNSVSEIKAAMLDGIMVKRQLKAIVLGGAPPSLTNMSDHRYHQPNELIRIRRDIVSVSRTSPCSHSLSRHRCPRIPSERSQSSLGLDLSYAVRVGLDGLNGEGFIGVVVRVASPLLHRHLSAHQDQRWGASMGI